MNLDEIQMKFRQILETKIRQKLDKNQTKFRTRSRLTHLETIQTYLEKKFRQIKKNSEHIRIQTKLDKIQTNLELQEHPGSLMTS